MNGPFRDDKSDLPQRLDIADWKEEEGERKWRMMLMVMRSADADSRRKEVNCRCEKIAIELRRFLNSGIL